MPHTLDPPFKPMRARLIVLIPLAMTYGVLSALRWPQTYALSHMMIDYHFGFGKRGLIGAMLEIIDKPPYHYVTLAWMAFSVFGLWVLVLGCAAWRVVRDDSGIAAAVILFLLSMGFACLVCDVGRGEHFGLLLAVPCLLMPESTLWTVVRAILALAAILMQEANYFIVVPFIAFDAWVGVRRHTALRAASHAACVLVPASLLTFALGNLKTACSADALGHFQKMAADFPFQAIPLATLCIDGRTNLDLVAQNLWSIGTQFARLPLALVVVLPLVLFNLSLMVRIVSGHRTAMAAAIVAALSPAAVIVFGVDVERFMTLAQATSLLVLISGARRVGLPVGGTLARFPHPTATVFLLLAFELGSSVTLSDGTQPLKFPFSPLVVRTVSVIEGHEPFVVIQ